MRKQLSLEVKAVTQRTNVLHWDSLSFVMLK
jgi:hypothetical protein